MKDVDATRLDPRALRDAFGTFPTGVTVVTSLGAGGKPVGFTANSFSSVSLDPPMLLVCPGRFLSSFDVFESCDRFAVNILAEGQEDVSNIFAGYKGDRFAKVEWSPDPNGLALIDGAAATFSCRTRQVIPAGDHVVLTGEVEGFSCSKQRGLGYAAGQYFSLGLERAAASAPPPGRHAVAGAIIEHDGRVLLEETPDGLRPPQIISKGGAPVRQALAQHLADAGLSVQIGKAYSIFEDREAGTRFTYFHARASAANAAGLGAYIPISGLGAQRFVTGAHASMLARFELEHATQSFNLYVGDEADGDVHAFEKGS